MKCENCGASVSAEFTFAIKNNQCPACGGHIMAPERLAAYASLKELLSTFEDVDVELVASVVIANFELKQRFKDAPKKVSQNLQEEGTIEVDEEDEGVEYKKAQMKEAKEISAKLKQMRQEALDGAIADEWGLGEANTLADKDTMHELIQRQRRQNSQDAVVSGMTSKNSFSRS